ncbi:RNA-binding region-containing protein 3-like [Salvia hispanica]|uniref:RNA-binding region-containing protein 3-like n=1 Tax=Salvia hispanica TaxID=49212 RepID=UPI00200998BF|nr:RNA-binding region-containing protein 3-like [Salvia hispanica]
MAFFALSTLPPSAPLFSTLSTPFKPSPIFLLTIPSSVRSMRSSVVAMAPDEEKMTRRSPLDFPIEWDRPKPGRRPDIFPQFSPMKTPLPPPMPADPPEEDEEDEEEKKEEEEENEEENADK